MRLGLALAMSAALIASAAADTLENSFGNTISITLPNGATVRYLMNADHSYQMIAEGSTVSGVWERGDGVVCLTPSGGERNCSPYVSDKVVGDTWTQTLADGSSATVTLTAGR